MRCINWMPEIVTAAFLNRLKLSITFVMDSMFRWACYITLFRYFEERTVMPSSKQAICLHPPHRAVRGSVTIERDSL
ncbi:hypothetical protein WM40_02970 [Robbsia andropogonis]|uniref:Uncharacterized protein n=1 Tax=Robbsia andropogonis TaxID=28092 RepID=A0A0F5K4S5_9BURK|nr:hypothetical protein WM40_02970 [Robbsia andropogonis]